MSGFVTASGHCRHLALGHLDRAGSDSLPALRQTDVVVAGARTVRALPPSTADTNETGHCMKLGIRVGKHVAQHEAAVPGPHVVDIDGH